MVILQTCHCITGGIENFPSINETSKDKRTVRNNTVEVLSPGSATSLHIIKQRGENTITTTDHPEGYPNTISVKKRITRKDVP